MKTRGWKSIVPKVLIYTVLILVVITIIYPFIFMILNSFKAKTEYYSNIFGLPAEIQFKNYKIALERFNVIKLGANSLFITVCSLAINSVITSMAAFGFSKLQFKGSNALQMIIIGCMMIPGQVLMIPVYLIMSKLGLVNTFASVILFYVATAVPFAVFMLTTQCSNIPNSVLEAAEIDGATPFKTYTHIIFPLLKPSLITLVILNFLTFWNELLYAMLFLQTPGTRTLTVEIATSIGKYVSNMPLLVTGLLLNSIPTILIFIFCQKYISKGLVVGAVK